ncbi:hypothetical protein ES703_50707 [subsurface metagenome]
MVFPSGLKAGSASWSSGSPLVSWRIADPSAFMIQIRQGPERLLEKTIRSVAFLESFPSDSSDLIPETARGDSEVSMARSVQPKIEKTSKTFTVIEHVFFTVKISCVPNQNKGLSDLYSTQSYPTFYFFTARCQEMVLHRAVFVH